MKLLAKLINEGYVTDETIYLASLEFISIVMFLYLMIRKIMNNSLNLKVGLLYLILMALIVFESLLMLTAGNIKDDASYYFFMNSSYFLNLPIAVVALHLFQLEKNEKIYARLLTSFLLALLFFLSALMFCHYLYFLFGQIDYYFDLIHKIYLWI